jgi:hypothetical protein
VSDMEYQAIPQLARVQVEAMLKSREPEEIARALLSAAFFEPDAAWIEGQCVQRLCHPNLTVRVAAITCISHLARLHRAISLDLVLPKLSALRDDPLTAGHVSDALDDIQLYVTGSGGGEPGRLKSDVTDTEGEMGHGSEEF